MKEFATRIKYFIFGLSALLVGTVIYWLFRPSTHISKLLSVLIPFKISPLGEFVGSSFLKFYFVDYLWAFSFSCWLRCIFHDKHKNFMIVSITGALFELMQTLGMVQGTGDVCDCLLYILAVISVNML